MRLRSALTLLALAGIAGCFRARAPSPASLPRIREVSLTVDATVEAVPEGTKELRIWIPVPRDDGAQALLRVIPEVPGTPRIVTDTRGNAALLVVIESPASTASASATFEVSRAEQRGAGTPHPLAHAEKRGNPDVWLRDPTEPAENARNLAPEIFAKAKTPAEKARAAWDFAIVHGTMPCLAGNGLFVDLLRVAGVPARPRFGLALPDGEREGTIVAYHCWAEWWDPERGWTPADVLAAQAHPERSDFYFGNLDADRVGLSLGDGVQLEGQARRNIEWVFPVAEADGSTVPVTKTIRFANR